MGKSLYAIGLVLMLMTLTAAGCTPAAPGGITPTMALPQNLDLMRLQIEAGDYATAAQGLEAWIAQNSDDAEAHFLLGLAYFNTGNYDKARTAFERTLALDPQRAAAVHHNLGALAYQLGELETAVEEFKVALEADPDDSDTHYQLGATYLVMALPADSLTPDEAMVKQAQTEFEKALELSPGKVEALVGMGNVHLLQSQVQEAIEVLEQAVAENPDMPEALFALGRTYAAAGQTAEAKQTLQRFLETNPPAAWAQQAQQLLDQMGE